MNIRSYNQTQAAKEASTFNALKVPSTGTGNLFVGGTGVVSLVNQTENFTCLGEMSTLNVVNRGNNAFIQGGSAGNTFISVGNNCTLIGSDKDDEVFSIGANCDISLGDGNDRICASGEGTVVDGGDGSDLSSGTLSGLTYSSLFKLDAMTMLTKIRNSSIKYMTK